MRTNLGLKALRDKSQPYPVMSTATTRAGVQQKRANLWLPKGKHAMGFIYQWTNTVDTYIYRSERKKNTDNRGPSYKYCQFSCSFSELTIWHKATGYKRNKVRVGKKEKNQYGWLHMLWENLSLSGMPEVGKATWGEIADSFERRWDDPVLQGDSTNWREGSSGVAQPDGPGAETVHAAPTHTHMHVYMPGPFFYGRRRDELEGNTNHRRPKQFHCAESPGARVDTFKATRGSSDRSLLLNLL